MCLAFSIAKTTAVWQWKVPTVLLALLLTANRSNVPRNVGQTVGAHGWSHFMTHYCKNKMAGCSKLSSVARSCDGSPSPTQTRYNKHPILLQLCNWVDQNTAVYRLDGAEFESRLEEFDCLHTSPGRLCGHLASKSMGTGARSGAGRGGRGVLLTTHLHQVPRLRISEAVPPRRLYSFIGWARATLPRFYHLF